MQRQFIKNDLAKQFRIIDDDTEFCEGLIRFIDEATDAEVILLHNHLIGMADNDYDTVEEFISDYQPLFDLVDIDLTETYQIAKKRKDLRRLDF